MDWITHTLTAIVSAVLSLCGAWVALQRSQRAGRATDSDARTKASADQRDDFKLLFGQQSDLVTGLATRISRLEKDHDECRAAAVRQEAEILTLKGENARQAVEIAALRAEVAELRKGR